MARTRDRVIALTLAILFFGTSFAVSFAVIWQLYKDNKEAKTVNSPTNSNNATTRPAKKLEGEKLENFTPVASTAELQTIDTTEGTGDPVKSGDTVTVDYTGAVAATGVIFQSSLDSGQPVSFPLDGVITGWGEGIPGMKVGGTRRLIIPAAKAYGANPPAGSNIPANADLVFDVKLHKIGE